MTNNQIRQQVASNNRLSKEKKTESKQEEKMNSDKQNIYEQAVAYSSKSEGNFSSNETLALILRKLDEQSATNQTLLDRLIKLENSMKKKQF